MAGVIRRLEWSESAEELYALYQAERDLRQRQRLQALWLVRQGRTETEAAHETGIGRRTLARWLSWYRRGGLPEVLRRVPGHGAPGSEGRLTQEQQKELYDRSAAGEFRSTPQMRDWVETQWGVSYRVSGMVSVRERLKIRPKVPRPQAAKADPARQEGWKRGG
ncbi:MAG: winged helix-turn-helix domain-containing protein [Gemmatimonadetes bacterium]|nr:winged helix-turn-helix domain-containing protein [Gemmatimonadota bacterium]